MKRLSKSAVSNSPKKTIFSRLAQGYVEFYTALDTTLFVDFGGILLCVSSQLKLADLIFVKSSRGGLPRRGYPTHCTVCYGGSIGRRIILREEEL